MFLKVVALIAALCLCACALLAARQMRMQAAHELAEARLRITQRDNELWRLRSRIAQRINPEHIKEMAARLGQLKPIAADYNAPGPASSIVAAERQATDQPR